MKGVTTYNVRAVWLGGGLTPAAIGQRFLSTLRQLGPLSPAMSNWQLGDPPIPRWVPLADVAPRMTEVVEHNVQLDDDRDPYPEDGYCVVSQGSAVPSEFGGPDKIHLAANVGGRWLNKLEFEVGSLVSPPDLLLVTYPIYKGALEALAANWPCPWALAFAFTPSDEPAGRWVNEKDLYARMRAPFEVAWIAYLSAPLAKGLAPPPEIVSERTPGGGVILSAMQERLDPANSEHMRRSRMLEAIMDERVGCVGPYRSQTAELPARVGPY